MNYIVGTAVFNDWIITREIGQGASGRVYEIKKNGYGEEIRSALKVIRIPQSPSDIENVMSEGMTKDDTIAYFKGFVNEILSEIKIMVSLKDHPNIVTYEDHCVIEHENEIGWDILIKMQLLTPLQEWRMKNQLDEKTVIRLGCEISSALTYASDHGLIHRDVKPGNIFVDSFGRFKLGDFGIARTIEETTGGLSKKGTESYMAPEIYLGKKYNAQVDMYSLGLVLYKYLNNNRLPFFPPITERISYSDRENALTKRIQGQPIPEPETGSPELRKAVLKACEYLPEKRFASMREMHDALQRIKNRYLQEETKSGLDPIVSDRISNKKLGFGKKIITGIATVVVIAIIIETIRIMTFKSILISVNKIDPVKETEIVNNKFKEKQNEDSNLLYQDGTNYSLEVGEEGENKARNLVNEKEGEIVEQTINNSNTLDREELSEYLYYNPNEIKKKFGVPNNVNISDTSYLIYDNYRLILVILRMENKLFLVYG